MAEVPTKENAAPPKVINLTSVKRTSLSNGGVLPPASAPSSTLGPAQPSTTSTSEVGVPVLRPVVDFRALKAAIVPKPANAPGASASPTQVATKKKSGRRLTSSLIILGQPSDEEEEEESSEESTEGDSEDEDGEQGPEKRWVLHRL